MSFSSPSRNSDLTDPEIVGAAGMICPKCHKRFPEGARTCTADQSALVRQSQPYAHPDDTDPMIGRSLDGRFTVLSKLGAGSMGTVYRARQHAMGREVAIKILRNDRAVDESAKGRFLREARANSLLASPHTVTVFDFGQTGSGELFLAMELLLGESLGQRITRLGRFPAEMAVDTVRQALRSLAEAHAKGIIHRDLKPDNLFFARVAVGGQTDEIVKVLDFGVAKMMGVAGDEPINAVETQAGTVFGTPRYMSPEQAQGKPLDARSDLYSLGVILYHMLTGRAPFTDDDAVVVMARHIKTPPVPASTACPEARIPADLDALLMRVLSKEPPQRPFNAEAMIAELDKLDENGLAGTSGVRASLVTGPTPWATPPNVGPHQGSGFSAGHESPGTDTLQAAGVSPRRGGRAVVGVVTALVLMGIVVAVSAIPRGAEAPPSPTVTTVVTPTPRTTPDVPPPPPLAVAPASTIPSVAADDLPRAVTPSAAPTAASTGNHRHHGGHPQAAPSASSSHYGYLE